MSVEHIAKLNLFKTIFVVNECYIYMMSKNKNELMMVSILEAGLLIDQTVNSVLKAYGITHIQYNVLRILNGAYPEALCMSEIKERLLFPNSDLTRIIDRMEVKELVIRGVCSENRRKVNIFISEKGQDLLNETAPAIKLGLNHFLENEIGDKSATSIKNSMDKIIEKIKIELA